jgi:hypothetical protein
MSCFRHNSVTSPQRVIHSTVTPSSPLRLAFLVLRHSSITLPSLLYHAFVRPQSRIIHATVISCLSHDTFTPLYCLSCPRHAPLPLFQAIVTFSCRLFYSCVTPPPYLNHSFVTCPLSLRTSHSRFFHATFTPRPLLIYACHTSFTSETCLLVASVTPQSCLSHTIFSSLLGFRHACVTPHSRLCYAFVST